ncbi:superoxide dismutase [Chaetomium strumarium]|uniref:superoxide dismutase n=1 Tax=Chaetomium strumarium TaxID=1170767 RepID=A0AAJ0M656_9PEZI|nr:superoxide dismutase [Chaetomium strumarium]
MRASNSLSLLLAAAGTRVAAQTDSSSSAAPSSTVTPGGPVTGELGDAPVVIDNPQGVVYKATLPESAFFKPAFPEGGNIQGEVTAVASADGRGVQFTLKLSNLPKFDEPLPYHIHVDPVPSDGNCTKTLAHLDPFIRGETPVCDASAPATCQVGDLSGKYGAIPTTAEGGVFEASYVDLYASTVEGIGAFFGNRSIVFHYPNKTRITCASFERVEEGGGGYGGSSSVSLPVGAPSSTAVAGPTYGSNATVTVSPTGGLLPPTTTSSGAGPSTTSDVAIGAAAGLRAGMAGALVFGGAAAVFML